MHDQDFTGFHRIEYGLWHGESAPALRAPAAALVKAVTALRDDWSQTRMDRLSSACGRTRSWKHRAVRADRSDALR